MDKNSENLLQGFPEAVESFTVYGGFDKDRKPEIIEVTLHKGDCACVCGKTGSGKTRLLEDIEYLASGDSPSGRKRRINGLELTEELRLELENRFCACLSQSMNFVMELSCRDFIFQHAGSRGIPCTEELMEKILACANSLAGEPLHPEDMITALSGGQSRALMIADIAFLSAAPAVLIDEPENAGIDKDAIFRILAEKGKIVLISTHDPILALSCEKRIFIENGGIRGIVTRTATEEKLLKELRAQEERMKEIRNQIRGGKNIG